MQTKSDIKTDAEWWEDADLIHLAQEKQIKWFF
jgi:hypothetical protein